MNKRIRLYILNLFCILGLTLNQSFAAGDTRNVKEPIIPGSCSIIKATTQNMTTTIQNEINRCATQKKVVTLQMSDNNNFHFYSGPLTIPSNGGLLINKGAVLSAIPDPSLYDTGKKTCGTIDNSGTGCKPFITVRDTQNSGIYGEGTIDGQGNSVLKGSKKTWWNLASEAKQEKKSQNVPRLIVIRGSKNFTLYKINLKNSPNFHVAASNVNGFTAWGININTPGDARNTDGIDPGSSTNVTIAHSYISTGDDNVAIKAGNGASSHMSIYNNFFGKGHGMSIGSETSGTVSDIVVNNLTMDGTTNGLHIKSSKANGGLVNNITYKNVCIKNVQYPILLDMFYQKNTEGNKIPQFKNIHFQDIKILTPGKFIFNGLKGNDIQVTFNNVSSKKGSTYTYSNTTRNGTIIENATGSTCPNYQ